MWPEACCFAEQTHTRHHTGTIDLQQATTQLASGLQHTPDQGPTLAAGWGVFSFLAASFSAALGLSSLAASFFSDFFSAACMPGRMMSEPSRQQQVPLCQETQKILPGIEKQANIPREATVSNQSLARADPVLPGQGDQTMTHSSLHSSQGAPCPRRLQQYLRSQQVLSLQSPLVPSLQSPLVPAPWYRQADPLTAGPGRPCLVCRPCIDSGCFLLAFSQLQCNTTETAPAAVSSRQADPPCPGRPRQALPPPSSLEQEFSSFLEEGS